MSESKPCPAEAIELGAGLISLRRRAEKLAIDLRRHLGRSDDVRDVFKAEHGIPEMEWGAGNDLLTQASRAGDLIAMAHESRANALRRHGFATPTDEQIAAYIGSDAARGGGPGGR